MEDAIRTKERYQTCIMKKANVVGLGIGYKRVKNKKTDSLSVVVLVEKKLPLPALSEKDVVQRDLDGIPTDIWEVGIVEALDVRMQGKERTERWRPAPGGVSIGHYKGSSGTLGSCVYDRKTHERLILSNNHILAKSNEARVGDPVLQPGPYDGGKNSDEIAQLEGFAPLFFSQDSSVSGVASKTAQLFNTVFDMAGSPHRLIPVKVCEKENTVDAAVALPARESSVEDKILDIGTLDGVNSPELGMVTEKSSRTTGHTTGVVEAVDVTVKVLYNCQRTALFSHQVLTTLFSKSGDSGSVIVSENKAVGLLFAGSENYSFCNSIGLVSTALNVEI